MDPTNLNQPVYTYTPSVKAGKVAAPNIQTYIAGEKTGVGNQFNAAVAAADEAARAGSTVQGKSISDYIAANRSVFDMSPAATLADGKSVADYQNAADGATSSSSTNSTAASIQSLGNSSTSKSFQSYINQAEGNTGSSSAASPADLADGKSLQDYFAAAGTSTPLNKSDE